MVLLGKEWQNGTCVFHAPTPVQAVEKAQLFMEENRTVSMDDPDPAAHPMVGTGG